MSLNTEIKKKMSSIVAKHAFLPPILAKGLDLEEFVYLNAGNPCFEYIKTKKNKVFIPTLHYKSEKK